MNLGSAGEDDKAEAYGSILFLACAYIQLHWPLQIRAYIADLCDCLADKSALVEELEEALGDLREERAGAAKEAAQVGCFQACCGQGRRPTW